ncbi:MAG TPA: CapA family protein [Kofleriaceae bacterium]|nr:CapA family protein [Kofleriaceae bacterium]
MGDLMLGSTYPDTKGNALPPHDGADLLADVAPLLESVDIALGNLEAPLFDGGTAPTCTPAAIAEKNRGKGGGSSCWAFRMPEKYGALLRDAGVDVVSLANNHIDDFGPAGRARTIEVLDKLGIAWSGPTGTVAHMHAQGRAIDVIAFATYDGLNDLDDHEQAAALVAKSAKTADLVIVSFHGGAEGEAARHVPDGAETFYGDRRGAVKSFARAMVDAGADLVVGHGPHVVRGMEVYRDRLIAYSLGTFASYRGIGVSGVLGVTCMLEVALAADGRFVSGHIHAVRQIAPGGPRRDEGAQVVPMVRELSIADFGEHAVKVADDGNVTPP